MKELFQTPFKLTAEERDYLAMIGNGTMVEGLRLLIDLSKEGHASNLARDLIEINKRRSYAIKERKESENGQF